MGIIESHWRKRQSRCADGIYFGTDEFIELCGAPAGGYRADLLASAALLLRSSPDGWTDLDVICAVEAGDFQVSAGAASQEGGGFIAVERRSSGRLQWLLHLSEAEPFIAVTSDGTTIHAISEEHPFCWTWRIPIGSPDGLVVTACHDF
jgi:hypothetical protein